MSDLDCPLIHQQKIHLQAPTTCDADQRLLLPLGKLDDLIWHFRLSHFLVLKPSCPVGGRHSHNGHLLCSSLRGRNSQKILTILSVSASMAESINHTTPSKVYKANTSSAEVPTAQALVARSGSKASNDAPIDDDLDLLYFVVVVSWIGC
jgi:hypothetical protein